MAVGVGSGAQVHRAHGERSTVAIGGDSQGGRAEQAHTVEILVRHVVDVVAESAEFRIIESAIRVGLGDVLSQDGQFAHTVERLGDLLEKTVLGLAKEMALPTLALAALVRLI